MATHAGSIARALLAAAGIGLLGACAHAPPFAAKPLPDLTSFALVRPAAGAIRAVSIDEALPVLAGSDVIVLGEIHGHVGNHLAQMTLYRGLVERASAVDLSLEQFERDVQPAIDDYLAGRIGEAALKRNGRAWNNYDSSYRPLVEYAKANGRAVIAANAPQDIVRCVAIEGLDMLARLSPEKRTLAAREVSVAAGAYRDKFLTFATGDPGHGGGTKEAPSPEALRSYAAQALRDDTMAESIALHLTAHPGRKVVHLTGYFHAEGFLGTVERLKTRNPALRIAVVNPILVDDPRAPVVDGDAAKAGTLLLLLYPLPQPMVSGEQRPQTAPVPQTTRPPLKCEL